MNTELLSIFVYNMVTSIWCHVQSMTLFSDCSTFISSLLFSGFFSMEAYSLKPHPELALIIFLTIQRIWSGLLENHATHGACLRLNVKKNLNRYVWKVIMQIWLLLWPNFYDLEKSGKLLDSFVINTGCCQGLPGFLKIAKSILKILKIIFIFIMAKGI